jgi:hypothetical protein
MMSFSEPDESAAASNTTVSLPKPVVIVSKPPSPSILTIPSLVVPVMILLVLAMV